MLDVGAGSGVVGLLVARDNPKVHLEAVEKQDAFVFLATKMLRSTRYLTHYIKQTF